VRRQSWFSGSHLLISEIFLFTYYWWHNYTLECIQRELKWSNKTVVDWANFAREVATEAMLENPERIGGPGAIVEIDESKFGKSMCVIMLSPND